MRHLSLLVLVAALVLAGLVGAGRALSGAVAQEASPAAGAAPPAAGATVEILDTGPPMAAPDKVLNFARLTVEPGGYLAAHGHPGAQIWYVDAGTITTAVQEGTIRLTRGASGGTPTAAEQVGPGAEVTLTAGDSLFFDHDVLHTLRNDGDETAVVLIAALLTAGEPHTTFAVEGTPAP
jgi:quercetin dioxygenase-like cupin family protein